MFLICLYCVILQKSLKAFPFLVHTSRSPEGGGAAAWEAMVPPVFGRSLNHIPTWWGRLCPPHYYWLPIFLDLPPPLLVYLLRNGRYTKEITLENSL